MRLDLEDGIYGQLVAGGSVCRLSTSQEPMRQVFSSTRGVDHFAVEQDTGFLSGLKDVECSVSKHFRNTFIVVDFWPRSFDRPRRYILTMQSRDCKVTIQQVPWVGDPETASC
jgi:hypothetical protein